MPQPKLLGPGDAVVGGTKQRRINISCFSSKKMLQPRGQPKWSLKRNPGGRTSREGGNRGNFTPLPPRSQSPCYATATGPGQSLPNLAGSPSASVCTSSS